MTDMTHSMTQDACEEREMLIASMGGTDLAQAQQRASEAGQRARETRTPSDVDAYADALSELHLMRSLAAENIAYLEGVAVGVALARCPGADLGDVELMARSMMIAALRDGGGGVVGVAQVAGAVADGLGMGLIRISRERPTR